MIWVWSGGLSGHRGTNIKLEDKCKTFRVLINLPSYNSNRSDAWTGLYGQECNYYIIHKSWWVNRIAKCSCDRITTTSAGSFTISEVHGFEAFVPNTIFETHTGRLIRGATLQVQRGQLCCTSGKSNNPSTNAVNSQGQDTVSQQQPILNISLSLSFTGNLPCIFWLKVWSSTWDAGVGVHIKTGRAAACSRLHTGATFLWNLAWRTLSANNVIIIYLLVITYVILFLNQLVIINWF